VERVVVLSLSETCEPPRAPVLACRDALRAGGAEVELVTARSDADIDAVLDARRLVVATAADAQVRAVVRRLVRKYAPAASARPNDLAADRTIPDLPAVGLLPVGPAQSDLVSRLGLPRSAAEVAAAVLTGRVRRLDLLRNDGGSVTLDGALLGGTDNTGRAMPFTARVEVDDAVLCSERDQLLAAVVANADGYATFDGLPLVTRVDPTDGVVDVAVATPAARHRALDLLRAGRRVEVEVRRARGRAVAVTPSAEVPYLDDGVAGLLAHRRTWWIERGAWAVYTAM
jgi:YegS C-terminal NAD kinase beta sandwich-like domain